MKVLSQIFRAYFLPAHISILHFCAQIDQKRSEYDADMFYYHIQSYVLNFSGTRLGVLTNCIVIKVSNPIVLKLHRINNHLLHPHQVWYTQFQCNQLNLFWNLWRGVFWLWRPINNTTCTTGYPTGNRYACRVGSPRTVVRMTQFVLLLFSKNDTEIRSFFQLPRQVLSLVSHIICQAHKKPCQILRRRSGVLSNAILQ